MRDYLNTTDAPTSYCGIIQTIFKDLGDLVATTEEGIEFKDSIYSTFYQHVTNNWMPLLFIGGIENKDNYIKFSHSDPAITNFGMTISNLIKTGDYNLLVNLCAEEHYKNTGVYPEWLEAELRGTSSQCKNYILTNQFDGINSALYENMKSDLVQNGDISIDETAEMYDKVIAKIKNHILDNSVVDTFEGQQVLNENIKKIFESNTPILDLKEFKTNAQQVAPHDKKLMDILKFVSKNVKNSPSLNVLLNIAKEEHLQNTGRANEPESDEVIKSLEKYWQAGDSEIEQAFKNGIFKDLKSNLAMNLKSDIIPDSNSTKIVNIPQQAPLSKLLESMQDLQVFSPVGVLWDDEDDNQKYAFVEDDIFQLQQTENQISYEVLTPTAASLLKPRLPESLTRFTNAFKELSYNPITLEFKPALSHWDFDIKITENGSIILSNEDAVSMTGSLTEVSKDDVKQLFVETLEILKQTDLSENSIADLQRDADNFIIVALNYNKLVLFEDLLQLQSLFENTYAIVPDSVLSLTNDNPEAEKTVEVISGSVDKVTQKYKSYQELVNAINKNIGLKTEDSVNKIFESNLSLEFNKNIDRQEKIRLLTESQNQLNSDITSKNNLLKIAQEGSPAQEKLQSELKQLNESLNQNLDDMDYLVNNYDVLK